MPQPPRLHASDEDPDCLEPLDVTAPHRPVELLLWGRAWVKRGSDLLLVSEQEHLGALRYSTTQSCTSTWLASIYLSCFISFNIVNPELTKVPLVYSTLVLK